MPRLSTRPDEEHREYDFLHSLQDIRNRSTTSAGDGKIYSASLGRQSTREELVDVLSSNMVEDNIDIGYTGALGMAVASNLISLDMIEEMKARQPVDRSQDLYIAMERNRCVQRRDSDVFNGQMVSYVPEFENKTPSELYTERKTIMNAFGLNEFVPSPLPPFDPRYTCEYHEQAAARRAAQIAVASLPPIPPAPSRSSQPKHLYDGVDPQLVTPEPPTPARSRKRVVSTPKRQPRSRDTPAVRAASGSHSSESPTKPSSSRSRKASPTKASSRRRS